MTAGPPPRTGPEDDPGATGVPAPATARPDTGSDPAAEPAPAAPARSGLVHDLVLPVAQAAVGGIVSAAVGHVAAKTSAPRASGSAGASGSPGTE